jgi:hypothetical protein
MKRRVSELEMCSATNGAPGRQLLKSFQAFHMPIGANAAPNATDALQQDKFATAAMLPNGA